MTLDEAREHVGEIVVSARLETWKPVLGFEGLYEVSDLGRVRSLDREVRHSGGTAMRLRGKILASHPVPHTKHLIVSLYQDGKQKIRYVHRLVLEAFAGPRPAGMESLHGPGGPADNRWPEALHYGTHRENMIDTHRDGTMTWARLTPELVLVCRARRAQGASYKNIADGVGMSREAVRKAVIGKTWGHVLLGEDEEIRMSAARSDAEGIAP